MDIGELSPAAVAGPTSDPMALMQLAPDLENLGFPVSPLLSGYLKALSAPQCKPERQYQLLNACLEGWIGQFGRAERPRPPREGAWKQVHSARQSALIKLLRLQAGLQQVEAERRQLALADAA